MVDFRRASHVSILLLVFSALKSVLSLLVKSSMAKFFGAGTISDAYFAAFTIPQQIGDFLVGGILFLVIIPIFQERKVDVGDKAAEDDISGLLKLSSLCLFIITVVYFLGIPLILPVLFSGFNQETLDLTISLSRWLSPSILLMGLSLIYISFYHAHRIFTIPALAVLFFPLISLLSLWGLPESWGIQRLVYGNLIGSFLGLITLILLIRKKINWQLSNWNIWNPTTKKTFMLAWPVLLSVIIGRIVPLTQQNVASKLSFAGAISLLEYSLFIVNFASMAVLSPISTAIFPHMGEQKASSDIKTVLATYTRGLSVIIFLTVPIVMLFSLEASNILKVVFKRGLFSNEEVEICAILLSIFSIMILFQCIGQITSIMFFIFQDTKVISLISSGIYLLTVPLYVLLAGLLGIYGIAMVFTGMHILLAVFSVFLLKYKQHELKLFPIWKKFFMFAVAALCMFLAISIFNKFLPIENTLIKSCISSFSGIAVYLLASYLLKIDELGFVATRLPFTGRIFSRFL